MKSFDLGQCPQRILKLAASSSPYSASYPMNTDPMDSRPVIRLIGSLGYAGLSPIMPGTVGSLVAAAGVLALQLGPLADTHWVWLPILAVLSLVVGIPIGNRAAMQSQNGDPQWFVLDEACGVFIALSGQFVLWPEFSPWLVTLVFVVLFRVFDILKPPPVRQLESLPGGAGIMLDDAAAGVMAWVCGGVVLLALSGTGA